MQLGNTRKQIWLNPVEQFQIIMLNGKCDVEINTGVWVGKFPLYTPKGGRKQRFHYAAILPPFRFLPNFLLGSWNLKCLGEYWPGLFHIFAPAWPRVGASVTVVVCCRDILALQLGFQVVGAVVNSGLNDAALNLQGCCAHGSCNWVDALCDVVRRHIGLTRQAVAR